MNLIWKKSEEEPDQWVTSFGLYEARIDIFGSRSYEWRAFFDGECFEGGNQFALKTAKDRARYYIDKHMKQRIEVMKNLVI